MRTSLLPHHHRSRRRWLSLVGAPALVAGLVAVPPAGGVAATTLAPAPPAAGTAVPSAPSARGTTAKVPEAIGTGGAVATVDLDATQVGIDVLRRGGNAVDAAVAAAAALGVTEPYSAGVGGGGFFVVYDARTGQVHTIDGRETAPLAMGEDAFVEDGEPIPFADAVTSGLSVGVPGTPATWDEALHRWGTMSLRETLRGATRLARSGFVVDETYRQQTADNAERFAAFTSTRELFLPGGEPPAVGTVVRNPDLARTYRLLAREGVAALYDGELGRDVVRTVADPPVAPDADRQVRPGLMEMRDLQSYYAPVRRPTRVAYRGLEVYGMAPPSSGGSTVGEALNILEQSGRPLGRTQLLHRYLEASALAFADRNRYVGDADFVDVPLQELLSDGFAGERACLVDSAQALVKPVEPGVPDGDYTDDCSAVPGATGADQEGVSTTHLTTADRWGNVVAYTLTIEQTGGSGIVVPDRGFLLNNELTDFNFTDTQDGNDPNLPAPGKRPRSSMSPTIVLRDGEPFLAVGSPGGSTIITTVLQTLVNRIDRGMGIADAIAAPRATQRNTPDVFAEPAFPRRALADLGHTFADMAEIGAATGVNLRRDGTMVAAAEPVRRGGGSAMVVQPR